MLKMDLKPLAPRQKLAVDPTLLKIGTAGPSPLAPRSPAKLCPNGCGNITSPRRGRRNSG